MSEALGNIATNRTYLNTFKGSFVKRVNADTPNAIKRINKVGKETHELHFNALFDMYLQGIDKKESEEYGPSWAIQLAHSKSEETFTLNLPYSGRITMGLFLRFPNIDFQKPFTLRLYHFEADDKTSMVVYQNDAKVENFWSKENPGDLPQLEKIMIRGKEEWDSTKRMQYLEKYYEQQVKPKLNNIVESAPSTTEPSQQTATTQGSVNSNVEPPIWDPTMKCLKKRDTDGLYYECEGDGSFKLSDGKKIQVYDDDLPF